MVHCALECGHRDNAHYYYYHHYDIIVVICHGSLRVSGRCTNAMCHNGGQCRGGYYPSCACPSGYQGPQCQYGESLCTLLTDLGWSLLRSLTHQPLTHLLTLSLTRSFIVAQSLAHSLTESCAQSFAQSLIQLVTHSFTHSFTCSPSHLARSLNYPPTRSLTCSPTHPFAHSLAHLLIHSIN